MCLRSIPDFGSSDVDVLKLCDSPVSVGGGDGRHLAVHVVLGLNELAAVDLASRRLAGHDVTLGLEGNRTTKSFCRTDSL